jgi:hypothetical protein
MEKRGRRPLFCAPAFSARLFLLCFISLGLAIACPDAGAKPEPDSSSREAWLRYMDRTARPVLSALADDRLKEVMPVTLSVRTDNAATRSRVTYLEAWGRTLSGIGPWLNGDGGGAREEAMRKEYRAWALKAVENSVNPTARDYMVWTGAQPLVDAAFFSLGLIRCPWLWEHLSPEVKQQVVTALKLTRSTAPGNNNWILFPAVIESFFCKYGLDYDARRIEYAVREFSQHWYLGDGTFSDGPPFHQDYYNSYVIQPFLNAVLNVMGMREREMRPANAQNRDYKDFSEGMARISERYAEIQERMINADGSFPVTGRSITYRCGAFHHLADMAARKVLPTSLPPAQVRNALAAVIRKTLGAPGTFDKGGWLRIGLSGRQEQLADVYITGGSLYLCMDVFLPLGLPTGDPFWSGPARDWTAVKVWSGEDSTAADHALGLPPAAAGGAIRPGELWPDAGGEHIQAHGGGILKTADGYFWYGEERRRGLDTSKRFVSCYHSTDLVHWKFRGDCLQQDDPEALGPHWVLERPKVFYNMNTRRYVMYFHLDDRSYKFARVGIAVSEHAEGPFHYLKSFRPLDHESRDIGQFIDDDGKAYLVFEDRPFGFRIARLDSADYLGLDKEMCLIPKHMEGGAIVHFKGLYYAIGSALTGWRPNPNKYATAPTLEGPWSEFRDIAPPQMNTYGSQSTMMLKVEGMKDTTVIFMGDIWKPGTQWESAYLWMPVQIGEGYLALPPPAAWTIDVQTGSWEYAGAKN